MFDLNLIQNDFFTKLTKLEGVSGRSPPGGAGLHRLRLCGHEAVEVARSAEGARSLPRKARGRSCRCRGAWCQRRSGKLGVVTATDELGVAVAR
jgi:hypothetical protein